jgi:REP-associated tyrosine transposase
VKYDSQKYHRRSIRLRGHDYAQAGAYFVTIVAMGREGLFGKIVDGEMRLNVYGNVARSCWDDLPMHYSNAKLDAFVVMPNHVHGIIVLKGDNTVGAGLRPAPTDTTGNHGLPEIVPAFKSFSARRINEIRNAPGTRVWQRNYYERIILNETALHAAREYVANNPARWLSDRENLTSGEQ